MESTYYKGYLKINGTKEFLKFKDNECKFMVYSPNHMYTNIIETDCFDSNGDYLGVYRNEKREIRKETKEVYNQKNVIQINYEFKILPIGRCVNQSEVSDAEKLINTCFDITPLSNWRDKVNIHEYTSAFYGNNEKTIDYIENFTPFEICLKGHRETIINKSTKTLNLDVKKYTKNKDAFIKENPSYKETVEMIYRLNIGFLCLFWGVSKSTLLRDSFNKKNKAFNKLNKRIKQKQ